MTDTNTEQAERTEGAAIGRPSLFTPELGDDICAQLALGKSLRAICLDDMMPNVATVYRWLRTNNDFRDQYARAREDQADTMSDEMLDIADDGSNDWMERRGEDGKSGYVLNGEHVQRSKLRIDTRKWIAAKLKPKKYGDRISQEITGPDGGAIITANAIVTREELKAMIKQAEQDV